MEQLEAKLIELRRSEAYTDQRHFRFQDQRIMVGSILSVHVIDARDLEPPPGKRTATPQARLQIESQSLKTQPISESNEPVWDEVIMFDIRIGTEPLRVHLYDMPSRIGAAP